MTYVVIGDGRDEEFAAKQVQSQYQIFDILYPINIISLIMPWQNIPDDTVIQGFPNFMI